MRGYLRSYTALAAVAALSMGSAFASPFRHADLGPVVIETGPRVHVQGPGGKRVPPRTKRAREVGKSKDPFFGIASRGRTGAKARAALMAEGFAKTSRRNRDNPGKVKSRVFNGRTKLGGARNAAFIAALNAGETHNGALKLARRVSTATAAPVDQGRPVPVHASGPVTA